MGTVKVVSNKVQVSVDFDADYDHSIRQCKLIVTPSIVEGVDSTTGAETATGVTSKTFNPSTNGALTYAQVSAKESVEYKTDADAPNQGACEAFPDYTYDGNAAADKKCSTRRAPTKITENQLTECLQYNSHSGGECHKLTVELDDPVLDEHSLGYLSTDLRIQLDCEKNNNGNREIKDLVVASGSNQKVRVRRTFVEHDSTHLSILPGAITVQEEAQWGSKTAKFLPVEISANVRAQTETGTVRFPTADGGWATFGESKVDTTTKELSCQIKQGATKADLGDADMLPARQNTPFLPTGTTLLQ